MQDKVDGLRGAEMAKSIKALINPTMLAWAREQAGYTVITEETGVGTLGKIPDVRSAMKVDCINLMQLIDAEDWVLG
jgi:hypothetical protein